jgi:hypothetical protein
MTGMTSLTLRCCTMHASPELVSERAGKCILMCKRVYECVYTCVCMYECVVIVYVCMYVNVCACVYVNVCVCAVCGHFISPLISIVANVNG